MEFRKSPPFWKQIFKACSSTRFERFVHQTLSNLFPPPRTLLVLRRDKLENTRQREIRVKNKETNYGQGGEDMKALIRKREGEIGLQKKFQKEEIKKNWREAGFSVR